MPKRGNLTAREKEDHESHDRPKDPYRHKKSPHPILMKKRTSCSCNRTDDRDLDSAKLFDKMKKTACKSIYKVFLRKFFYLPARIYEYHMLELADYTCLLPNVYIQKKYYASPYISKRLICTKNCWHF